MLKEKDRVVGVGKFDQDNQDDFLVQGEHYIAVITLTPTVDGYQF